ncbi:MAG: DUF2807 domain-containing protein [Flavobacteriales bacterium]|nr:DUF2807 domain-containing protein [Flavobacteriales bacterium]
MKRLFIISLILFGFSCKKEKSNQVLRFEILPTFNQIVLKDYFDVFLIEDSSYSIEIKTNENLMKHIQFKVIDSVLTISNEQALKWRNPQNNQVSLHISSSHLREVTALETCNIRTLNPITTKEFGIILGSKVNVADIQVDNEVVYYWNDFPCGGKLTLSGKTKELKIWNSAILSVDAKSLICEKALVNNNSKGNCEVNVSQYIEYSIEGEGDIIAYGNPKVIIENKRSSSGHFVLR